MSLNIKKLRTCQLVSELAQATGETMTQAIETAVAERLARLRGQKETPLAERLLAIGRDCAERLGADYRALDHDALLYDENGLPR
jgi:antitoxin VapB